MFGEMTVRLTLFGESIAGSPPLLQDGRQGVHPRAEVEQRSPQVEQSSPQVEQSSPQLIARPLSGGGGAPRSSFLLMLCS